MRSTSHKGKKSRLDLSGRRPAQGAVALGLRLVEARLAAHPVEADLVARSGSELEQSLKELREVARPQRRHHLRGTLRSTGHPASGAWTGGSLSAPCSSEGHPCRRR